MKSSVFQDAVESSAKVTGRKAVKVVFEGNEASTDGDVLRLPALPASAEISIDQADIIRGYRDHEVGHVRCTDTSPATLSRLKQVEVANKHHGTILQYCEDVRIENAITQEYPGTKNGLTATNTHAAKMLLQQIEARGDAAEVMAALPKPLQFRMVLQARARSAIGVESGGVFDKLCDVVKVIDPALHDLAEKFAKRMVDLPTGYRNNKLYEAESRKGTAESFKLAEEIFQAYTDYSETPPPPPQGGEPDDDPLGDDNKPQEESDGGSKGQGKGQGKGKGQGSSDGSDGDGKESDEKPDGTEGSGDSESDDSGGGKGDGKDSDEGDDEDGDDGQGGGKGDEEDEEDGGDGDGQGSGDDDDGEDEGDDGGADGGEDDGEGEEGGDGGGDSDGDSDEDSDGSGEAGDGGDPGVYGGNGTGGTGSGTSLSDSEVSKIEQSLDDLYKSALKDVVDTITDSKDNSATGRAKNVFKPWSSEFSVRMPFMTAFDGVYDNSQSASIRHRKDARSFISMIDRELTGKKAMIRRVLELELQARSDRRWENGKRHGRLQSVRLVDAIQGREAVYQKRESGKDMDTLLYISIDGSGSMSGSNAIESVKLAYALSEALERTGCEIIVEMWGDQTPSGSRYGRYAVNGAELERSQQRFNEMMHKRVADGLDHNKHGFTCLGQLMRGVIKEKRQRVNDAEVLAGFGCAVHSLASGTPSYHAVFEDLKDLAKESQSKKVYLHITDGVSNRPFDPSITGKELMKEAHTMAKSINVHMIGVGINGMNVSHLFPDNVQVAGADAYEPVIRKLAKLVAQEAGHAAGHAAGFKRAA